jgi:hypothetical protein
MVKLTALVSITALAAAVAAEPKLNFEGNTHTCTMQLEGNKLSYLDSNAAATSYTADPRAYCDIGVARAAGGGHRVGCE